MVFPGPRKLLDGEMVSDLSGDRRGSRKTLPFALRRRFHPAAAPHLRHQFRLPTEPRISTNRSSTAAFEPFSQAQPNATLESTLLQTPAKTGGLTLSRKEP